MHALVAFALGPFGRWVAGGGIVLLLFGAVYAKGYVDGRDDMQAKYEAREAKASAAAKKEADRVQGGDRSKVEGFDRD